MSDDMSMAESVEPIDIVKSILLIGVGFIFFFYFIKIFMNFLV